VKCGLCLPVCPTYSISHNENESPRGRIALMQALVSEQLGVNSSLLAHLDHCLLCRACERACPANVQYGAMVDQSRYQLQQIRPQTLVRKLLQNIGLKLLTAKNWQFVAYTLLRFYQNSGLQIFCRYSGLLYLLRLHHLERLLPKLPPRFTPNDEYPSSSRHTKGRLGLFTGCINSMFDQETVKSSITILNKLGFDVVVPKQQTCCGALHLHQGEKQRALELAQQNIQTFDRLDVAEIVYVATGCGVQLSTFSKVNFEDKKSELLAKKFSEQLIEITEFLSRQDLTTLNIKPLSEPVIIHTPCSASNKESSYSLLSHIPEIKARYLKTPYCCGAAGTYMVSENNLARQIRCKTTTEIMSTNANIVTTTNIGCALHIKEGLNPSAIVKHPVALLASLAMD